jgi:hypothetical protein
MGRTPRLALGGLILVLAIAGATVGLVRLTTRGSADPAPVSSAATHVDIAGEITGGVRPGLVFRTTSTDARNGLVGEADLDGSGRHPSARRAIGPVCDRVYAVVSTMVCLRTVPGVTTTFEALVLDARRHVRASWELPGLPSRARVSPSGRLVATTVFVSGVSYGQHHFQTATEIRTADGVSQGNLDSYALFIDGRRITTSARNIWGVTFRDDNQFYATAEVGGRTWLVRGDLEARSLFSVRQNAECPSVSPGGRLVAYKKRTPVRSTHWSIAVLDLSTGRERVLPERRSVDDQVEWLDDSTLLYGLERASTPGVTDIWRIGLGAGVSPHRLVADAWSPSVVGR